MILFTSISVSDEILNIKMDKKIYKLNFIPNIHYRNCVVEFINLLLEAQKENIYSILLGGSLSKCSLVPDWSDIDFLCVFNKINLHVEQKLSKILNKLNKKYGIKIGSQIITRAECQKISGCYLITPKARFILQKVKRESRVIYGKNILDELSFKDRLICKRDAIEMVTYFLNHKRQNILKLTGLSYREKKRILASNLKICFNIVRIVLRYRNQIPKTYEEVIAAARHTFKRFNFNPLYFFNEQRYNWKNLKDEKRLVKLMKNTDTFVEKFAEYFFKSL